MDNERAYFEQFVGDEPNWGERAAKAVNDLAALLWQLVDDGLIVPVGEGDDTD